MSEPNGGDNEEGPIDRKKARVIVGEYAERLGVPYNIKPMAKYSAEECETLLLKLNASPAEIADFNKDELRFRVARLQTIVKDYRTALIDACLEHQGAFNIHWMNATLDWKVLTSHVRPLSDFLTQISEKDKDDAGDESDGESNVRSANGNDETAPPVGALMSQLQELRAQLETLRRERGPPPDGDEDKPAGGNRIKLPASLLERLPKDPVRAELEKHELTALLRDYPPALDYYTKGGILSTEEKAKLDPKTLEEHNRLGKYVQKFSEIARPLLGLAAQLQSNVDDDVETVPCAPVLTVLLHALNITFHHATSIEKERKTLQFKDSKVLQSVFSKQPVKSMLNASELAKLAEMAAQQKVLRNIREDLLGKKRSRPSEWRKQGGAAGNNTNNANKKTQQGSTGLNFGGGRGKGQSFRNPSKGKGKGTPRKQGTGEARGQEPTAQNP